jgi:uncharacterized membrane protein
MSWNPFKSKEEQKILDAIQSAEKMCSGEIRVHMDEYCKGDVLFKATNVFNHLEMDKTDQRNGVLIYVAVKDRKFCIIGDIGIDQKVPSNFWESTRELMQNSFVNGSIPDGIVSGIHEAGQQLKEFFPAQKDDIDELPDDISYGE